MKILHLCLSAFYIEGLSYQENLLPKCHRDMGHDVYVIASLQSFSSDGEYIFENEPKEYTNKHGVKVKQLAYRNPLKINRRLKRYKGTYDAIATVAPDIIFCHGVQFSDASVLTKYMKKHPQVVLYVDNHADFSNSATNWISKNIQHKILWRHYAQKINPYVKKFYGVLPARVDFLADLYKLPREKIELLVMGSDDELIEAAAKPEVRREIREKYGIAEDDFLVIYGGKTDAWKKQTLLLMDAVNKIDDPKVKLIIFGSVTPDLKEDVEKRCSDKVQYIGWVQSEDSYNYFAASDIAVFPGRHSVFWEQVAGQGIPMIVKYWDGTTHVDHDGNVIFLYNDDTDEIKSAIETAMKNYSEMKAVAEMASDTFSYVSIAARSIEAEK